MSANVYLDQLSFFKNWAKPFLGLAIAFLSSVGIVSTSAFVKKLASIGRKTQVKHQLILIYIQDNLNVFTIGLFRFGIMLAMSLPVTTYNKTDLVPDKNWKLLFLRGAIKYYKFVHFPTY